MWVDGATQRHQVAKADVAGLDPQNREPIQDQDVKDRHDG